MGSIVFRWRHLPWHEAPFFFPFHTVSLLFPIELTHEVRIVAVRLGYATLDDCIFPRQSQLCCYSER
jgi:hypothetical protein